MENQLVLVLDFGGRNNQGIARMARDLGVYCEMHPYNMPVDSINAKKPIGIILAGEREGTSINGNIAPTVSDEMKKLDIPTLIVFTGAGEDINSPNGSGLLKKFLFDECGARGDWNMSEYAGTAINEIRETVKEGKVLLALSGGVDSSVVAALLSKAIGNKLTCIFVDTGLMRKNERNEVEAAFKDWDINLISVDAERRFLDKLKDVREPERKRKIIGEEFIRVFEEEAKKIGSVDFLAQGTIYADIIESGVGSAVIIKSHHNVGGLPEHVDFKQLIEPLRLLFKDEVRKLGEALGLPEYLFLRQPFPGPGLGIRVIGCITKEKLDIIRDADFIFRDEITKSGLHREINQYFAILTDMRSVGVTGDERSYDYVVALRGVVTADFMTAEWAKIPYDVLDRASRRIASEVNGVNRVVYDVTSKPPATIEWE